MFASGAATVYFHGALRGNIERSTVSIRRVFVVTMFLVTIVAMRPAVAQEQRSSAAPGIGAIIARVSPDSLMDRVRELCGEKRIRVLGMDTLITNRFDGRDSANNELAGDYLERELLRQGLNAGSQPFGDRGRNIIGIQRGAIHPEISYIICAHYDAAVFEYPAADDNASGTAGVLEAARLLAPLTFDYTIHYILWDGEERGLVGSRDYARAARLRGDSILGVINLDMIGWDSDGDARTTLQYNLPIAEPLIEAMRTVNDSFSLGLDMVPEVKPTTPSDSYSFAQSGYPAFLFIEDFADFTPHYHKATDLPGTLNVPFFTAMTRAAVGALAMLAGLRDGIMHSAPLPEQPDVVLHVPMPHPVRDAAQVSFMLPREMSARLELFDLHGRRVALLADGQYAGGRTVRPLDATPLAPGTYVLRLTTPTAIVQRMLMHLR